MSEEERDEAEIQELKENAKNLSECLHTLMSRIDALESKRSQRKNDSDSPMESSPREVHMEKTETTSKDGATITKRIHVTERVVTKKTYQVGGLVTDVENRSPSKSEYCVIGVKKKKSDNHLGLTVRQENGQLVVARVMNDSPLAKQGIIHVGDCVLEVNGIEVKTPDDLQNQLKKAGEGVSLKIVPSGLEGAPPGDGIYVKSFVDYDPQKDDLLPCKEIGLPFKTGDILQIISKEDPNWWQARNIKDYSRIGLIPSDTLEETRKAGGTGIDTSKKQALGGLVTIHKRRKVMYNSKQNASFDGNDITIYEEVGKLSPYGRRVLVLVGAPGVGRRTIKSLLLQHDPKNFATVTPYTSRSAKSGEQEGREYHFVTRDAMQKDVDQGHYLESGEFNGNLYGTSMESVRQVVRTGRMCVLDCTPQAIKLLYNYEFMPYIVFLAPPPLDEMKQLHKAHINGTKPKTDEEMQRTCEESVKLENQLSPLVDLHLVNRNIDVTFRRLSDALESLKTETQWVPISWIYG